MLEEVLSALIHRRCESRGLDYKGPMAFDASNAGLLKDLMAFANTQDGGYIVVGVAETVDGWQPVGLEAGQAATFDVTTIGDALKHYCSRLPDFSASPVELDGRLFILINVRQFEDEPVVCTRDLHSSKGKLMLRAGSVYVRTGHATSEAIQTAEDMQRLIATALVRRGDSVLRQIRALMGPLTDTDEGSVVLPFDHEMADAQTFFEAAQLDSPYWQVVVRPVRYITDRVPELSQLRVLRQDAEVSIRGWNFPHTAIAGDTAFEQGIQSVSGTPDAHAEAHRLYRSGLFIWRSRPWEAEEPDSEHQLSYLSAIWSLTEFFLFASRFANDLIPDEGVTVSVRLTGFRGWQLVEQRLSMPHNAFATADRFEMALETPTVKLVADHEGLAVKWSRRLFELFNADIAAGTIADWQAKFQRREF